MLRLDSIHCIHFLSTPFFPAEIRAYIDRNGMNFTKWEKCRPLDAFGNGGLRAGALAGAWETKVR